jgi:RNA polymerase sigma factor (sigma-70 family)
VSSWRERTFSASAVPTRSPSGNEPGAALSMLVEAAISRPEQVYPYGVARAAVAPAPGETELVVLIHRQMRALAGPRPDLEDLVQTALEQVLRARFEGRSAFATFTHAICYRVWMKHLRSRYRWFSMFSFGSLGEADEPIEVTTPHDLAAADERIQSFYRVLGRVSPKRRAVVVLHDIGGEDIPSIASIVVTSEATVRTRLRDGRKRLRELLAEDPYFMGEFREVKQHEP